MHSKIFIIDLKSLTLILFKMNLIKEKKKFFYFIIFDFFDVYLLFSDYDTLNID